MNISQSQKAEEDPHPALPNNPFIPPKGDTCFINNLPPELLSRIFEVGAEEDGREDEDDIEADLWEKFCQDLDGKGSGEKSTRDSDAEMNKELEDEEETEDEDEDDATESSDSHPSMTCPRFAIVVSHVCRHWRNVAFSTPSLWTTIEVTPMARPPYELESTLLERSKSLPIDIYVDCEALEGHPCCEPPSSSDLLFLYTMLASHIHRWRTMEVSVSDYNLMYIFLIVVSGPSISGAPQLTTLELYDHEEREDFNTFEYPKLSMHRTLFSGSAPLLTRIVLWGVHVDWDQPWIASASNLTELELAYHSEDVRPSWAQFVTILRGATSLEKLSLHLSGPSGEPPEWYIEPTPGGPADLNTPIHLPRVTDFILAFQPQARAIGLVRKLNLPALKHLVLDFDEGDYTDFVHELAKPTPSSSPAQEQHRSLLSKLETLKISGLPCPHG